MMRILGRVLLATAMMLFAASSAHAEKQEYLLGPGDVVRIGVFQNPDLTTEARVSEMGRISFPLLGEVEVGGLSTHLAENRMAELLRQGGFVAQAQVTMLLIQMRSQQVSVLGQVNQPGKYPIEVASKVSDMLAMARGIAPNGSDEVILVRIENGHSKRTAIDTDAIFQKGDLSGDLDVAGGDVLYVPRAPQFYIYGEVQRPGAFRLEKNMTVMQALSVGGGVTSRGTERGVKINRRNEEGLPVTLDADLQQTLRADDVVYVRESLF